MILAAVSKWTSSESEQEFGSNYFDSVDIRNFLQKFEFRQIFANARLLKKNLLLQFIQIFRSSDFSESIRRNSEIPIETKFQKTQSRTRSKKIPPCLNIRKFAFKFDPKIQNFQTSPGHVAENGQ